MIRDDIYDGDGKEGGLPRIRLTPSPQGKDCLGNGEHDDIAVELRCDECGYFLYCFPQYESANLCDYFLDDDFERYQAKYSYDENK